jgi:hypothetical protein
MPVTRCTLVIGALALTACASPKKPQPQTTLPSRPLAGLAGQHVVVLPTHYLRPADSLGWATNIPRQREYLRSVDDEIAFALGERGFRTNWIFPEALAKAAKRNAGYTADPYALAAEGLRPPGQRNPALMLRDPLASQIRSLVALNDSRYVLFPVELRFEKDGGMGRAVLRVALIDARLSQLRWVGDVHSDPAATFSPGLAASLAGHLADLIAAP